MPSMHELHRIKASVVVMVRAWHSGGAGGGGGTKVILTSRMSQVLPVSVTKQN